jgi:glycosyltransferase involved in cell wall biosynthesis
MRVQLSNHIFSSQTVGGISNYFLSLAKQLEYTGNQVDLKFPLALTRELQTMAEYRGRVLPAKMVKRGVSWRAVSAVNSLAEFSLEKIAQKANMPDVYHRTYYSETGNSKDIPEVLTVYDMIHEDFPQFFRVPIFEKKKKSIDRASHVICISQYTRDRLIALVDVDPELVSVVPLGIDMTNIVDNPVRWHSGAPYVLYVGGRSGYKNFQVVEKALAEVLRVHRDLRLLLVGGGPITAEETERFKALGIEANVSCLQDLIDLEAIIREAQCVVSSSLVEGFGLVPLEALCEGTPCVISDIEVNREIWGDSLPLFDPLNHFELASEILKLIESDVHWVDVAQQGLAVAKLHSSKKMAEETLQVYQQLALT